MGKFDSFYSLLFERYRTLHRYSLQRFYFENDRPVFDLMVLWSKALSQWMMEGGNTFSRPDGWDGSECVRRNWNYIIPNPHPKPSHLHVQPGEPEQCARTHAHRDTHTQALQKAHLRNCRCHRDTAHRRKRRALRKSPSASRRPPRRRWGRMGSRSTTPPPLPQGS